MNADSTIVVPENPIRGGLVDGYVKIAEAAELLNAKPRTVNHWIRQGYFPNAIKLNPMARTGSPYYIPVTDIEDFIQKRKNPLQNNEAD